MHKVLLDTDILSEILRGVNQTVVRNANTYRDVFGRFTISVITVMEMVKGFQKAGRPEKIASLAALLIDEEILDFDRADADQAGRIWGDLERTGKTIGLADPMIAAVALRHGLQLVTGNTVHYQRVQQLGHPLTLANWRV